MKCIKVSIQIISICDLVMEDVFEVWVMDANFFSFALRVYLG